MKSSGDRLIRLIAVFKLIKAGLLIALGVQAFKLLHHDIGEVAERWVEALRLDPGHRWVEAALEKASNLGPEQIKKVGLVGFIYAGLFLTEGLGLWWRKRWAEWLTIVITGSLVPVEIFEIVRHPNAVKVVALVVNVAIVAYLIYRIRNRAS